MKGTPGGRPPKVVAVGVISTWVSSFVETTSSSELYPGLKDPSPL